MKNKIIILGLAGTGKTTLAKTLAEKINYIYLNDWKILDNKQNLLKEIEIILSSNEKVVLDLDLRNFENYVLFESGENQDVVYLLFGETLGEDILFKVFQEKDKNISVETVKGYLDISKKYKAFCIENKLKFIEISKDRNEVLMNILNELKK